jgi:hypothetical protein
MIHPPLNPANSAHHVTLSDPANFVRKTTAKAAPDGQDSAAKDTKPKGFPS